jgi:hypothetical protein
MRRGDRRSEKAKVQACDASLKYGTAEHWVRRLRRDHPELAERVVAGEISATSSSRQALPVSNKFDTHDTKSRTGDIVTIPKGGMMTLSM